MTLAVDEGFMRDALASGLYSDFVITCQGRMFKVHKVILAASSEFFRALLRNDCQVCHVCDIRLMFISLTVCQETRDGKVDLAEDDPEIIALLLKYLYTGVYGIGQVKKAAFPTTRKRGTNDLEVPIPGKELKRRRGAKTSAVPGGLVPSSHSSKKDSEEEPLDHVTLFDQRTRVYAAADKFGVSILKDVALELIRSTSFDTLFKDKKFPVVAERVLKTTSPDDRQLRLFLIKGCVQVCSGAPRKPSVEISWQAEAVKIDVVRDIDSIMIRYEPMAWRLGLQMCAGMARLPTLEEVEFYEYSESP